MSDHDLMVQQMASCLFVLNRPKEVQALLKKQFPKGAPAEVRYNLVLALIAQNKNENALNELLALIDEQPNHQMAKKLAFELIIRTANDQVEQNDWENLSATLSLAIQYAPDSEHARAALAPYRDAMPLFHLRSGERQKAADIWLEQLTKNPKEPMLIHNLAVLFYFSALHEEEKAANEPGGEEKSLEGTNGLWSRAIGFQVCLMNSDAFWNVWLDERTAAWGRKLTAEEIERLKKEHLVNAIQKPLQKYIDKYHSAARSKAAQRMENCLARLLLEQKSASMWKSIRPLLPKDLKNAQKQLGMELQAGELQLLNLDGGSLFFEECGVFPRMKSLLAQLEKQHADNTDVCLLALIYESSEAALLFATIEERNRPAKVLEALKNNAFLPVHHAAFLRALAYLRLAEDAASTAQVAALDHWESFQQIYLDKKNWKASPGLEKILSARFRDHAALILSSAQKWVSNSGKTDSAKAIKLLERCLKLTRSKELLDTLASLYCDLGEEKLADKRYETARSEFRKALEYSPDYSRAKDKISICYNNEAVDESNHDKAISLYEKALEANPTNNVAKANFATELNSKAVDLLNAAGAYASTSTLDRAIKLLKRACILDNPQLADLIESRGTMNEYLLKQLAEKARNDGQKQRLDNLAVVIGMRNRR